MTETMTQELEAVAGDRNYFISETAEEILPAYAAASANPSTQQNAAGKLSFQVRWFRWDNETARKDPVTSQSQSMHLPAEFASAETGSYIGCSIMEASDTKPGTTLYFRRSAASWQLVGIYRPGL